MTKLGRIRAEEAYKDDVPEAPVIVDGHRLLEMELPKRRTILAPWLREKDVVMVHAWRGLGKTWFGLDMAIALATGQQVLGWQAERKETVLYVDGEMPAEDLRERIDKLRIGRGLEPHDLQYLVLYPADLQNAGIVSLSKAEGRAALDSLIEKEQPSVIFLDNLATLTNVRDTNDGGDTWSEMQGYLLRLRREGRTIIFVHHQGKNRQQRGLAAKEDTLSAVIGLYKPGNAEEDAGAHFDLRFEKRRNNDGQGLNVRLVDNGDGGVSWDSKPLESDLKQRAVELEEAGMSQREIGSELDMSVGWVNKVLKAAKTPMQL